MYKVFQSVRLLSYDSVFPLKCSYPFVHVPISALNDGFQQVIMIINSMEFMHFIFCSYTVQQGSPNVFDRGPHTLSRNSSRAGHLCNVMISGYVTFYQINTFY